MSNIEDRIRALRDEARTHAAKAREVLDRHPEGKNLPAADQAEYQRAFNAAVKASNAADNLEQARKDQATLDLFGKAEPQPEWDQPGREGGLLGSDSVGGKSHNPGSQWAKTVAKNLNHAAGAAGVKALLAGEIRTPSVVEVVGLPDNPQSLLQLMPREALANTNTFGYVRQMDRTNNADVVPDNTEKPVSEYSFKEFEDRCRVIAHLSEPFPVRYLTDYTSIMNMLDWQMRLGVLQKLEQQLLSGTGTGEQLPGLLTLSGVRDVPFAGDPLTTIRKARTVLDLAAELPNAWLLNPNDIEKFELAKTSGSGEFILNTSVADMLFGEGVARIPSAGVPESTAILGDFRMARLVVREDAATLASTQSGELFQHNQVQLRAEGRFGVKWLRPSAFAVVHLAK